MLSFDSMSGIFSGSLSICSFVAIYIFIRVCYRKHHGIKVVFTYICYDKVFSVHVGVEKNLIFFVSVLVIKMYSRVKY